MKILLKNKDQVPSEICYFIKTIVNIVFLHLYLYVDVHGHIIYNPSIV